MPGILYGLYYVCGKVRDSNPRPKHCNTNNTCNGLTKQLRTLQTFKLRQMKT